MKAYRKVDDHYVLRLDSGRMALAGVGAALVLLLVFLLGVLVGRLLWRPAQTPALVERVPAPAAQPLEPEPRPGAAPGKGEETEFTFYEELKKPEPPPAEPSGTAAAPSRTEAPPARREPVKAGPGPEAPQGRREAREERPRVLPAPVFTVQVGSFRERGAAERLVARMRSQGVEAGVVEASVAGKTWYRVQVGRFTTRAAAETHYRSVLRPKGIRGFVTTR